jgi:hypothetical protein
MKKQLFMTGMFSIVLAFGLVFVGCDNPANDDGNGNNTPNNPVNPPKNITVYIEKPASWSQLYAYVWDDSGKEFTATTPGTALTTTSNGFYSYQAQSAEYGYVNVRFSDGGSGQTLDILGVDADTYYQSAGSYAGDSSKILLRASNTATIVTPQFKAQEKTDSTITLAWDPIPGIDGYILYDEFVEFDDNDEEIPDSEYWHFQKAFVPSERNLLDDNYGEYLDPESIYTWKLIAIKYNDNANLSGLDSLDPDYITEDDYSAYYTVVYNFGELEVETEESSLSAPTNLRVTNTGATSVELAWNDVPDADYYMVWWYDDDADEWLYIEEAYDNQYIDSDEEFIFPDSSYKYLVVAHNKKTYSNDSNEITAYTTSGYSPSVYSAAYSSDIVRAVVTPSAPYYVGASANPFAANQISTNWIAVSGVTKYEVGLFTSKSGSPKSGTTKTVSGSFSGTVNYTYTSVPASPGVYYVGVRSVNGSQKSNWSFSSSSASPFPKVSIQSSTSKISGNYKTITIKMNASWKTGASYSYRVTLTDPKGYGGYSYNTTVNNTNTITISNVPKGPKYTVTIQPYTGGVYGNMLTKSNL